MSKCQEGKFIYPEEWNHSHINSSLGRGKVLRIIEWRDNAISKRLADMPSKLMREQFRLKSLRCIVGCISWGFSRFFSQGQDSEGLSHLIYSSAIQTELSVGLKHSVLSHPITSSMFNPEWTSFYFMATERWKLSVEKRRDGSCFTALRLVRTRI